MTFLWDGRQFKDLAVFRAYVMTLPRYWWIKGITIHHTGVPTIDKWGGAFSFVGTKNYYKDTKRWLSGPHLFWAKGSKNPNYDGVFYGTPLEFRGTHAGECNSTHIGFEVVGNYDQHGYPQDVYIGVCEIVDILFDWLILPVNDYTVMGHRECLPNKSCPGWAINMDQLRSEIAEYRKDKPNYLADMTVIGDGTRVRKEPNINAGILKTYRAGNRVRVESKVVGQSYKRPGVNEPWSDQWAKLVGGGYIWYPLLK